MTSRSLAGKPGRFEGIYCFYVQESNVLNDTADLFQTLKKLRTALFWVITQREVVISYRRFGTTPVPCTYLLTPWCRVLLEKLTALQLVKKFPAFHGTRRFITELTSGRHLSLSWASPIQSIYPHPTSWRSILIISTHLRLGLPSGLLPSGFPTKTLYTPLSSPIRATCPTHRILLDFITRTILGSHAQGSKIQNDFSNHEPKGLDAIDRPETSVRNYRISLRNDPEERSSEWTLTGWQGVGNRNVKSCIGI